MKEKRLLDQVRDKIRSKHGSIRTESAYTRWIKQYIFYHNKRHPGEMKEIEIEQFLNHLVLDKNVAPSTKNQAFNALIFLYTEILDIELGEIHSLKSKAKRKLPTVLSNSEAMATINLIDGVFYLIGLILYGSGLRLLECLRMRVKDIDFELDEIVVRDGKGLVDRRTVFPEKLKAPIREHLFKRKKMHERDVEKGFGSVYMPYALSRKYRNAENEWIWQYVFPSKTLSIDPRSGIKRRHHLNETSVQKAIKKASKLDSTFYCIFYMEQ